jgi:chromosome segregation ATPase
VAHL